MRFGIDSDGWLYKLNPNDDSPALHIRPLPQATGQAKVKPWSVILHSQAASKQGSFQASWNWWTSPASSGSEAHLVPNMDGQIMQFMPFTVRADCNYKANGFYVSGAYCGAVSMETQDLGADLLPTTPWPPEQFETIAQVIAALHVKYGIPLEPTPSAFERGIGFHRQYPEWSVYRGKTCPGDARVQQVPGLIERARQIVAGPAPTVTEDNDDMSYLFKLASGDYGVRGPGGSRRVSGEEFDVLGLFKREDAKPIPSGSNLEYWIKRELSAYDKSLGV